MEHDLDISVFDVLYQDVTLLVTFLTAIATLVTAIILIIEVRISIRSHKSSQEAYENSQNAIQIDILMKFQERLRDDKMLDISALFAEDKKILKDNGGPIEEYDLIKYMTIFSELNHFVNLKVLKLHNVYPGFFNYAVPLSKNNEVLEYVKGIRENQEPHTWEAIYTLGKKLDDLSQMYVKKGLRSS